jgi:catechol 2,3-dioxygenase-like lactoylglutathione lyase family enzyme
MALIPLLRCNQMEQSIKFYTGILDFVVADGDGASTDPCFRILQRQGHELHLSSHAGDGVFGSVAVVRVSGIQDLFAKFQQRGLDNSGKPDSPVHQGVVLQTWGTKEFYADDPDGNTIRFIEQ